MSILIIFKQRIPLKLNVSDKWGTSHYSREQVLISMPESTDINSFLQVL